MPLVDLTRYIVASSGTWTDPSQDENLFGFTRADTMSRERLLLRWAGDFVALTGPLRVRVTVQAENMTVPLALVGGMVPDAGGSAQSPERELVGKMKIRGGAALHEQAVGYVTAGRPMGLQASTIYSYTLDVAAGQAWPFSLSEQLAVLRLQHVHASRFDQLGNNLGFRVIIEPAFKVPDCTPVNTSSDLPCDFAVADQGNTARFFPAACEPCDATVMGLPPGGAVSLVTPPAEGGMVRTRFFNGMFITSEDLETEQRYARLKSKLHNRASGAGVVWGLGVGKHGSHLCVLPGYGVDCCGNDLTLTTTYKVEIGALMADPAGQPLSRQLGGRKMALLLEYVECPSNARPVHGDPCATDVTRCEMSRVRETVRLRLVPPRDCCDEVSGGPLKRFLDEARDLKKRHPVETITEQQGDQPAAAPAQTPFQLRFTVNRRGANAVTIRPSPEMTSVELPTGRVNTLSIEVLPDAGWKFTGGTLSAEARTADGEPATGAVEPEQPIDLAAAPAGGLSATFTMPTGRQPAAGRVPRDLRFNLAAWQAENRTAATGAVAAMGDVRFEGGVNADGMRENQITVRVLAAPIAQPARKARVCGDPCSPRGWTSTPDGDCGKAIDSVGRGLRSSVWLHDDPLDSNRAGDPKALLLGALGGWLTEAAALDREDTSDDVRSARTEIGEGIYRAAWLILFGVSHRADAAMLGKTLHRLLEAWCDNVLWKGPQCCGDPHGVVIGCALVDGGTIQTVDPFGGRRYVVHYPLLEHWGGQFGLAPLDATAMRFFQRLCCWGSLAPAQPGTREEAPVIDTKVGDGHLLIGDPRAIREKLGDRKIAQRRSAGLAEMIVAAVRLLSARQPARDTGSYTALTLEGFAAPQTVVLLVPA